MASKHQQYYQEKREEILEQKKIYRTSLKNELLRKLGGKCRDCGTTELSVLSVQGFARGKIGYTAYYNQLMRMHLLGQTHNMYLLCLNCVKKGK